MRKKDYNKKDIEKIIAIGKQKGYLTYDEVNELLPEDISSSEDIDRIFELLGEEDIRLVENEQAKEIEKQIEPPQKEAIDYLYCQGSMSLTWPRKLKTPKSNLNALPWRQNLCAGRSSM